MIWNRLERELRDQRHALALGDAEAEVFERLYLGRGRFTTEAQIARECRLTIAAVQGAVRRLRRRIVIFDLFIVGYGRNPTEFRLVHDGFANSNTDAGRASADPAAPTSRHGPTSPCPGDAPPDSFAEAERRA